MEQSLKQQYVQLIVLMFDDPSSTILGSHQCTFNINVMVCYVHIVKCSNDIVMFLNVKNATYVHDALFFKVAESSGH